MGFRGHTDDMVLSGGGLFFSSNNDTIPPNAMLDGSRNINLHTGGRKKRGGTQHLYSAALDGASDITGLYHYKQKDGDEWIITGTAGGKLYKDDTNTIKTGLTADKLFAFETFNDTLYVCNTADRVQTWAGTGSTANLTNPATDWGTTSPRQLIKHGLGNSSRLWALGVPGFEQNIYASADGSDNFVTGVVVIAISTDDIKGIVGGIEFGNRLIVFSRTKAYIIDDTSADTADWGYTAGIWKGGAASFRLIVKTDNDVHIMTPDGDVYSLIAVQQYGDYKIASLARPAFIDNWIRENVDLDRIIDEAHGVFDDKLRAVKWFLPRNGHAEIDTALLYFLDRPSAEAWSLHENQGTVSGYTARCSAKGLNTDDEQTIMTGDYSGFVWYLESAEFTDDGDGYDTRVVTPFLTMGDPRLKKNFVNLHVITSPNGNFVINFLIRVDGILVDTDSMNFGVTGGVYGSSVYGSAYFGGTSVAARSHGIRKHGVRIQYEFWNTTADEDFFITRVMTDWAPLGKQANMGFGQT